MPSDSPRPDPLATAFAALVPHGAIAWDFDDTLVGHRASVAMHHYIATHPEQTHVIITFRSHTPQSEGEAQLWRDLAQATSLVDASHFAAVMTVDGHLADTIQRLRRLRAKRLFAGPECAMERAYRHWKGMICAKLGARVLIDDRADDVQPGCDAFGVLYLHPDVFL